jgi:cell filamentation protein, protein adenylyltransferase
MRGPSGYFLPTSCAGETVRAFVPNILPPAPPIIWDSSLQALSQKAMLAVGRLDGLTRHLPDVNQFLYTYIRKEALLSSQIEGTESSLSELLLFENAESPGVPTESVLEVSNYVAAMEHGLKRLREGFPLSLRLIREIHGQLLAKGRGSKKQPGEFRTTQNWIGGSRPGNASYVPPPHDLVLDSMGSLEKFLHADPNEVPPLIKAALAHVQFETIHPFLDGNGRVGRLLITFLLCHESVLQQPLLYLSLYLKQHRKEYYELLQRVRTDGVWEEWLAFFFQGVASTANQAAASSNRVLHLFQDNQRKISKLGGSAGSVTRIHELLQRNPMLSVNRAIGLMEEAPTFATVSMAFSRLAELGIAEEKTGGQRNRVFAYKTYLEILNEGTEPI